MIAGVTHLTMEAEIAHGADVARRLGFRTEFVDAVALPSGFERVEPTDHRLPLALFAKPGGLRLEVVQHRWRTENLGAYTPILRCPPPAPGTGLAGGSDVADVLRWAGALSDPVWAGLGPPGCLGWFEAGPASGGLAGLLCSVPDIAAEAGFWSAFGRARWVRAGPDAAWGTLSSPLLEAPCHLVVVRRVGERVEHAMNDAGFPSIGVYSTALDRDCARAIAAGGRLRAEPITATVGGRSLRMALVETPGGAPVELLSLPGTGRVSRPDAGATAPVPADGGSRP